MRIGVFIGNSVPQEGGVFSFVNTIIDSLSSSESRHEFYVFYYGPVRYSSNSRIKFLSLSNPLGRFGVRAVLRRLGMTQETNLQKAARAHCIEIMWFLTNAHEEIRMPYILTVLDLEHRVHPFFPEVSVTGNTWDIREKYFSSRVPKAAFVITGTEAGKREIIRFYHAEEKNIRVVPFPASSFARQNGNDDVLIKYNVAQPYLFYPAQFWPHKNHIGLLLALKLLNEKYSLGLSLVLCGSDKGNLGFVKEKIKELGLDYKVRILGFVPEEDLSCLYKKAFALVFASFFGPDNLPPLEAFSLGCPVIAADVPGAAEQLGEAAILVNPCDEQDMALAVKRLHDDTELRGDLIRKGLERIKWGPDDYLKGIISIIDEFECFRRCWSSKDEYLHL